MKWIFPIHADILINYEVRLLLKTLTNYLKSIPHSICTYELGKQTKMASLEVGVKCQTCKIRINISHFLPSLFRWTEWAGKDKQNGWLDFKVRLQLYMKIIIIKL